MQTSAPLSKAPDPVPTEAPRSVWIGGECTLDAIRAQLLLRARCEATARGKTLEAYSPALFAWSNTAQGVRVTHAATVSTVRRRRVLKGSDYRGLALADKLGLSHTPAATLRRTGGGRMSPSPRTLLDQVQLQPGQCVAVAPKDVYGAALGIRAAMNKRQLPGSLITTTHGTYDGLGRIWWVVEPEAILEGEGS